MTNYKPKVLVRRGAVLMDEELREFMEDMEHRLKKEIHSMHISNGVGLKHDVIELKQQFQLLENRISSLEETALRLVNKVIPTVPDKQSMVKLLPRSVNPIRIPMALSTKQSLERHRRVMEKLRKKFEI